MVADEVVAQRYLGGKGLLALLALLSAFVPLSTDLYLPALPRMGEYFRASSALTNLTLVFSSYLQPAALLGPLQRQVRS